MCTFKVGQTVIRTIGGHLNVNKGDICRVKEVYSTGDGIKLEGHSGTYDPECFALYVEAKSKKITIDVCHRLVAYDCELGELQARLDNMRADYQRQLEQLEDSIDTLTSAMDTIKLEYNVE